MVKVQPGGVVPAWLTVKNLFPTVMFPLLAIPVLALTVYWTPPFPTPEPAVIVIHDALVDAFQEQLTPNVSTVNPADVLVAPRSAEACGRSRVVQATGVTTPLAWEIGTFCTATP